MEPPSLWKLVEHVPSLVVMGWVIRILLKRIRETETADRKAAKLLRSALNANTKVLARVERALDGREKPGKEAEAGRGGALTPPRP